MKTIQFCGKEVPVVFNMGVQIAFEKIAEKPFDLSEMTSAFNSIALCYASIVTANPDTDVTLEDLLTKASAKDIATLKTAVFEEIEAWCEVPKTMTGDEKKEDGEKNSSQPATPTDLS